MLTNKSNHITCTDVAKQDNDDIQPLNRKLCHKTFTERHRPTIRLSADYSLYVTINIIVTKIIAMKSHTGR